MQQKAKGTPKTGGQRQDEQKTPTEEKHKLCGRPTHWHNNTMGMRPPGATGTLSTGGKNTAGGPSSVGKQSDKANASGKGRINGRHC